MASLRLRARAGAVFTGYMGLMGAGPEHPEWASLNERRAAVHDDATALFDTVADPLNWKGPIDALVWLADDEVDDMAYAIEFFTATTPTITKAPLGGYHITAAGYAAGPAGDH
jgi:hypothetical protein